MVHSLIIVHDSMKNKLKEEEKAGVEMKARGAAPSTKFLCLLFPFIC